MRGFSRDEKMTAVILAGGRASRLGGCDKAFLKISDETLITRQLRLLKKLFKRTIIVTNSPHKYIGLKNVDVVTDIIPEKGPLGGIYSALLASSSFHNFVVACDMPFLNEPLIRYMLKKRDDYDVLISKVGEKFHPLCGIYSRNCIPVIEEMLKQNRLKVSSIFPKVKAHFLTRKELEKFDKGLLSLVNINTKKDYKTYCGAR